MDTTKDYLVKQFIADRVAQVNKRYMKFELDNLKPEQWQRLKDLYDGEPNDLPNTGNSAILWVLGLTQDYDPIRRCSYEVEGSGPDIDTDFAPSGKERIVKALQEKYGYANVASIGTYTPWNLKTSVIDFSKVVSVGKDLEGNPIYGTHHTGKEIADQIPDSHRGKHTTWKSLSEDDFYKPLLKKYKDVFAVAGAVDGQPKTASIHPCGILIHHEPLDNYLPIRKIQDEHKNWIRITQFDNATLEKMNLTKYDLLVIDNLDISSEVLRLIGKPIEWLETEIPLDDKKAFDLINDGIVGGLFQIEESHVVQVIRQTKPSTIHDISCITSLIRPGPKDAGLTSAYVKYRQTGINQNDLHPLLDKVLAESGGVMVYQEQVMSALQILAGFTLGEADEIRRAMGKKKPELMAKYRQTFIEGCFEFNKLREQQAAKLWESIEKFADYGWTHRI